MDILPHQKEQYVKFLEEQYSKTFGDDPCDIKKAEEIIKFKYKALQTKLDKFVWSDSPVEMYFNIVKDAKNNEEIFDNIDVFVESCVFPDKKEIDEYLTEEFMKDVLWVNPNENVENLLKTDDGSKKIEGLTLKEACDYLNVAKQLGIMGVTWMPVQYDNGKNICYISHPTSWCNKDNVKELILNKM